MTTTFLFCFSPQNVIDRDNGKDFHFFLKKLEFTPCKAEQPLQGMELQEKETQKD